MNFLELCQRTARECGVSGTGPADTTTQVGNLQRIVQWVNSAYVDIQNSRRDWDWMRQSNTFVTVDGQSTYELGTAAGQVGISVATFGMWARDTARNYLTSVGTNSEVFMDFIHYDTWRNNYMYGALRNTKTRPLQFAISPTKGICLGPVPIDGYTISCDYFTAPVELSGDSDDPIMPTWYHMAIVYRAMMFYGGYESATEVYQRGELEFGKLMSRMTADRMPEITFAGALA